MKKKCTILALITTFLMFFACMLIEAKPSVKAVQRVSPVEFEEELVITEVSNEEELVQALNRNNSHIVFQNDITITKNLGEFGGNHKIDLMAFCLIATENADDFLNITGGKWLIEGKDISSEQIYSMLNNRTLDIYISGGLVELKNIKISNNTNKIDLNINHNAKVLFSNSVALGSNLKITGDGSNRPTLINKSNLLVNKTISVSNADFISEEALKNNYSQLYPFKEKNLTIRNDSLVELYKDSNLTNVSVSHSKLKVVNCSLGELHLTDQSTAICNNLQVNNFIEAVGIQDLTINKLSINDEPNTYGYIDDIRENGTYYSVINKLEESYCKIFINGARTVKIEGNSPKESFGRIRFNFVENLVLKDCIVQDVSFRENVLEPNTLEPQFKDCYRVVSHADHMSLTNVIINCRLVLREQDHHDYKNQKEPTFIMYSGALNYGIELYWGSFTMFDGYVRAQGSLGAAVDCCGGKFYMHGGKVEHIDGKKITTSESTWQRMYYHDSHLQLVPGYFDVIDTEGIGIRFYNLPPEWISFDDYVEDDTPLFPQTEPLKNHVKATKVAIYLKTPDCKIYGGTVIGGIGGQGKGTVRTTQEVVELPKINEFKDSLENCFKNMIEPLASLKITLGGEVISSKDDLITSDRLGIQDDMGWNDDRPLDIFDNKYTHYFYCYTNKTLVVTNKKPKNYEPSYISSCDIRTSNENNLQVGQLIRFDTSYSDDWSWETSMEEFVEYKWAYSYNGESWRELNEEKEPSLSLYIGYAGELKLRLSVIFKSGEKTRIENCYSKSFKIKPSIPVFKTDIEDIKGLKGSTVQIVSNAFSSNELEYQWYRGRGKDFDMIVTNGTAINKNHGGTSKILSVDINSLDSEGAYFVCAARSYEYINGNKIESNWVYSNMITVSAIIADKPMVTLKEDTQVSNTIAIGHSLTFGVDATNLNGELSYYWEFKADGSTQWAVLLDNELKPYNTNSYTFIPTVARHYMFRCVVTNTLDGIKRTTKSSTIHVEVLPLQPVIISNLTKDQYLQQSVDQTVRLTFDADNGGIGTMTYQWYYSNSDKPKDKLKSEDWNILVTGGNQGKAIYNDVSLSTEKDTYFRCKVTNTHQENTSVTYTEPIKVKVTAEQKIKELNVKEGITLLLGRDEQTDNSILTYNGRYYEVAPRNEEGQFIFDDVNDKLSKIDYKLMVKFNAIYSNSTAFSANNVEEFAKVYFYNKNYGSLLFDVAGNPVVNSIKAEVISQNDYIEESNQVGYTDIIAIADMFTEENYIPGAYSYFAQVGVYYKDATHVNQEIVYTGESTSELSTTICCEPYRYEPKEVLNVRIGQPEESYYEYFSNSFNFYISYNNVYNTLSELFASDTKIYDKNGNQIGSKTIQDISSLQELVVKKAWIKYANSEEYVELVLTGTPEDLYYWDTSSLSNDCVGVASCYIEYQYYKQDHIEEDGEGKGIYYSMEVFETEPFFINLTPRCDHINKIYEIVKWGTKDGSGDFERGVVYTRCNDCGEVLDALGKTIELVSVNEIPATCVTDGHKAYKYCPYTNQLYSAETKTTGSSYHWVIEEVEYADLIIKADHMYDIHHEFKDCTCEKDGNIEYYECSVASCGLCFVKEGETYVQIDRLATIIEKSHLWDTNWTIEDDVHYHECLNDDTHSTPMSNSDKSGYGVHEYNQQVVNAKFAKVAGNCINYGEYYTSCICGKSSQGTEHEQTFIPSVYGPHDCVLHEYLAPSKEADGHIAYKQCKLCHKYFNEFDVEIQESDILLPKIAYELTIDGSVVTITPYGDIANGVNITDALRNNTDKVVAVKIGDKGFITFNNEAVLQLVSMGMGITLTVKEGNNSHHNAELVLEISINGGGITFGGEAKATISYLFDKKAPNEKVAKVYYVNEETREDMNAHFSETQVTFDTTHFSTYIVIFEDLSGDSPVVPPKAGLPKGAIIAIVISSILVLGIAGFAVYWFAIKKKKFSDLFPKKR